MPAPRPVSLRWTRIVAAVLLLPYLTALFLIVWLPADDAEAVTGIVPRLARLIARTGLPFGPVATVLEFTANITLFIPLGLLLALALPRIRWWQITLIGLALSAVIEIVQIALPSRYSTLSDVIANTTGAAVGAALAPCIIVLLSRSP